MSPNTVVKTIHQYNAAPLADGDMIKLKEIAGDYSKVKNYVYQRYGGIGGLSKLYPGYTVQNEMIDSGLRDELGLPFVYFNLAVFEALGDIRNQWSRTKTAVLKRINQNEKLSDEEKHFLRYLLKVNNAFDAVLNRNPVALKAEMQIKYELFVKSVNTGTLENYLRRQVRQCHVKPESASADGFALTERAYRYADHGIYITIKEKRKRIFVLLTDNNKYNRQIYIKLYPEQNKIMVKVPINVQIRQNEDYRNIVGVAVGMYTMLVTDEGHAYGEKLGEYQIALAEWIRSQSMKHMANIAAKPGRKKYTAKKQRMTEQMHSYINMELNRFLKTEKPQIVYFPKLPKPRKHGGNKEINNSVTLWQRGYIKDRLRRKCQEQSVEFVEVFGKNISNQCSCCGAVGLKTDGLFVCQACGCQIQEKQNTARNVKKRGTEEHPCMEMRS